MNIYLIGFMGCGKSSIGRRLSSRFGYDRIDTDDYIETMLGRSVSEIFSNDGECKFREIELNVLEQISFKDHLVVSTGGGMVCSDTAMSFISAGVSVYIRADSKTLANRIYNSNKSRPLTDGKDLRELECFVSTLLGEREVYYNRANIIVDAIGLDLNKLEEIISHELDKKLG